MAVASLNGTDIYYESHGRGEPLVLIAGYGCDHLFWSAMLDELAERFQVILFDNRGAGQTTDSGSLFNLETLADDTVALIKHLGLKQPHILGHSMGGAIAEIVGKKYPDNIRKLVILNSTAKFNTRTLKTLKNFTNLVLANIALDLIIETSMPWFFSNEFLASPEHVARYIEAIKTNPYPQTVINQARQYNALVAFDAHTWAHEISVPTLLVAAEDDIVTLPQESLWLAHNISNAQIDFIPGGHSSPIERPKDVNHAVLTFLTKKP